MTAVLPSVPVLDEDETYDPWCTCPDGMPCCCATDSTDPTEWGD